MPDEDEARNGARSVRTRVSAASTLVDLVDFGVLAGRPGVLRRVRHGRRVGLEGGEGRRMKGRRKTRQGLVLTRKWAARIHACRTPKTGLYYISGENVQKESPSSNPGPVRNLRLTVKILEWVCQPPLPPADTNELKYGLGRSPTGPWGAAASRGDGGGGRGGRRCRRGRLKGPGGTCECC